MSYSLHRGFRQIVVEHPGIQDYPPPLLRTHRARWTFFETVNFSRGSADIIPSWNVRTSGRSGFYMSLRVRRQDNAEWSHWMPCATWGKHPSIDPSENPVDWCHFEIDHLKCTVEVDAAEVRIAEKQRDTGAVMDRLTFSLADDGPGESDAIPFPALDLRVPFRSQHEVTPAMAPRVCSPTCVAMLLNYYGIPATTEDVAAMCYDHVHDIYGHWNRAIQTAFALGLRGYVQRFAGWAEAIKHLENGRPLVASIAFAEGALPGSAVPQTNGHLVVIRGLEPHCVIVNDPAAPPDAKPIRYPLRPFSRAWFGHGGVCYVFGPAV